MSSNVGECEMIIVYLCELVIEHYRGLEKIEMEEISNGTNLIIGPNDAGKTTILEAIKLLLSLGQGVVLTASDYYLKDINNGFEIKGKVMCEWDSNIEASNEYGHTLQQDEGDKKTPRITSDSFDIVVTGTDNMQLSHSVDNSNKLPKHVIDAAMKSLAATHLVGSNQAVDGVQINATVAQSAPLDASNGDDQESAPPVKSENEFATPTIQSEMVGTLQKVFRKNGLIRSIQNSSPESIVGSRLAEMNLTTEQAGVQIPISCWGAGNYGLADRLATIQVSGPILLIDKIEGDLDSKRQHIPYKNILESTKQSFVSTISPTILSFPINLENSENLTIWHVDRERKIAKSAGKHTKTAHRSQPSAFFSTIPVIGEGATEVGLLDILLNRTFKDGYEIHGIDIYSGNGNQGTIFLASEWRNSNHKLFYFVDNEEDPSLAEKLQILKRDLNQGAFQWPEGNSEKNIINAVPEANFERLIRHPTDDGKTRARLRTVLEYLNKRLPKDQHLTYDFVKRVAGDECRQIVIDVASSKTPNWFKGKSHEKFKNSGNKWFKSFEGGKELGEKLFSCEAWTDLKENLMPFSNTLRGVVGLPEITDLFNPHKKVN